MKYIIIGLGTFGSTLGTILAEAGHEVIGVDLSMERVEAIKEHITHAVCMDATNQLALETLPLRTADVVIVGIGEDAGASIMATALLKQMRVNRLIGRALNPLHQTVLETMQIEEIIQPEKETAQRLAARLEFDQVIESFSLSDRYTIAELKAPAITVGHTVGKLDLSNRFSLNILTIIRKQVSRNLLGVSTTIPEVIGVINADTIVEEGDILVIFGTSKDLRRFIEDASTET